MKCFFLLITTATPPGNLVFDFWVTDRLATKADITRLDCRQGPIARSFVCSELNWPKARNLLLVSGVTLPDAGELGSVARILIERVF